MTIQKSILDISYIPIQVSNSSNCPYIDSKIETRAFINLSDYPESHDQLAEIGFRRVENWAYKPICNDCNQCIPLRIDCKKFKPNQNQRRCISKKLIRNILPCLAKKEHFQLFKKYQKERHENGLMSKMTWDNYSNMINLTPINSMVFEYKNSENKYDVEIKLDKTDKAKIKDNKGKVTRYSISISANLKLSNVEDGNKIQRVFVRNGDFDVASNHSDTINNEKNTTKNIIQQLSDDIISFITLAMRN